MAEPARTDDMIWTINMSQVNDVRIKDVHCGSRVVYNIRESKTQKPGYCGRE